MYTVLELPHWIRVLVEFVVQMSAGSIVSSRTRQCRLASGTCLWHSVDNDSYKPVPCERNLGNVGSTAAGSHITTLCKRGHGDKVVTIPSHCFLRCLTTTLYILYIGELNGIMVARFWKEALVASPWQSDRKLVRFRMSYFVRDSNFIQNTSLDSYRRAKLIIFFLATELCGITILVQRKCH
jgi:hypothetical protein